MRCPNCGSMKQTCFDSRLSPSGRCRKRSRKCRDCGYIFHTLETIIRDEPAKIGQKQNGNEKEDGK